MSEFEGALCVGKWWLFDSTALDAHHEARKLCADCPALLACSQRLREAQARSTGGGLFGPQGTWAGQLYGREVHLERRRRERARAKARAAAAS